MNERTLELAKQAGLKVESWMTNPPKPFQILGSTEQFETFAELIWQAAYEEGHDVGVDAGFEAGRNASFTEQHFGVEG